MRRFVLPVPARGVGLALGLGLLLAAGPAAARWVDYRQGDGLGSDAVTAIDEGPDGSLWFGTTNGLTRFDGVRWTTIRDSLAFAGVSALVVDARGDLWVGSNPQVPNGVGIRHRSGGTWSSIGTSTGELPSDRVQALLEDAQGDLWVGCGASVVRFDRAAGVWRAAESIPPPPGEATAPACQSLARDSSGTLWVGTPRGLTAYDPARDGWQWIDPGPTAPARDSTYSLHVTPDGALWVGGAQGLYRLAAGAWRHWTAADGLARDEVTAVTGDGAGGVWAGCDLNGGLAHFDGVRWERVPEVPTGVPFARVGALLRDRSGNLWVGTLGTAASSPAVDAQGALLFDGEQWTDYLAPGAPAPANRQTAVERVLPSPRAAVALETARGEAWIGLADAGVSWSTPDGGWSLLTPATQPAVPESVTTLLEDRAGRLWIGSKGRGVARLDSSRATGRFFTRGEGMAADSVTAILEDRAGEVWLGGPSGLTGIARADQPRSFLPGESVLELAEDGAGTLWVRTESPPRLFRAGPDRAAFQPVILPGESAPAAVQSLTAAASGAVWFSTSDAVWQGRGEQLVPAKLPTAANPYLKYLREDRRATLWLLNGFFGGAALWDGSNLRVYPSSSSVGLGNLNGGLADDGAGTVWLSSGRYAFRFNGSQWSTYRPADGLASQEVAGASEGRLGRVWFPSPEGLARYEPPTGALRAVVLGGVDSVLLRRDAQVVVAAAFGVTQGAEFRYRLDGALVADWTPATTLPLAALADGPHTLEVDARDWTRREGVIPARVTWEVDATAPAPVLAAPAFGDTLRGVVTVRGQADDRRFASWRLERKAAADSWAGAAVETLAAGTSPVADGPLCDWNTIGLTDGFYDLRLVLRDTFGVEGAVEVRVQVDNQPPFAGETSPLRVRAQEGGSVATLLGEMRATFPPGGFDADATVTFAAAPGGDGGAGAAGPLPDGVRAAGTPFALAWSGATLRKPFLVAATLPDSLRARSSRNPGARVASASASASAGAPVLYRGEESGGWTRLGGSRGGGDSTLTATADRPGLYLLALEDAPPTGAPGVAALQLTPRILRRGAGGGAGAGIAIGFSLGAAAPVTIRIYSRSGRLVRGLADGQVFGPGQNVVTWDGRDGSGEAVVDGVYLVTVESADSRRTEVFSVLP